MRGRENENEKEKEVGGESGVDPEGVASVGGTMPEVSISALDARQQKLIENARAALERENFDYALEACAAVLAAEPGCVTVRRLQRDVQLTQLAGAKGLVARAVAGLSAIPFVLRRLKATPEETLQMAERWLATDPKSVSGLKLLAEAARALEWRETTVFALEAIREVEPGDRANLVALGEAWIVVGRAGDARRLAEEMLRSLPADAAAQELLRRAALVETVTKGNWEAPGSFREKLNSDAEARNKETPREDAGSTTG